MKKILILLLLPIAYASLPLSLARAHELKSESSISVLIHINPDDDPVAGQPSEILFLINDKDKHFQAENCNCTASVIENGETLFSSPVFKGKTSYKGIFAPAIPYTFPHKGVYTVILTGKPKNQGDFQSFSISYDIRIEKDASTPAKPLSKNTLYYFVMLAILAGIIYLIKENFFVNISKRPKP